MCHSDLANKFKIYFGASTVRLERGGKNMYAIVVSGGKQHKAEVGKFFKAEKVNAEVGSTVELPCLLFVDDNGKVAVGKDAQKVKVVAEVLENGKDDKVLVFKYKPKKNELKKQGHRQPYSKLKIVSIG